MMEYSIEGLPARSLELPDTSSLHVESYEGFVAVTWSTSSAASRFLNLAAKELRLGYETHGLVVDSKGKVHPQLALADAFRLMDYGGVVVARLDDAIHGRAAVWERSPTPHSQFAEVGVSAVGLDRAILEKLFRETCTKTLLGAIGEVFESVEQVAGHTWDWHVEVEGL